MTDNEKFYAKSMFPSLLGAQTSTIDWRIRNGHPLPKPDMVITGAGGIPTDGLKNILGNGGSRFLIATKNNARILTCSSL